MRVSAVLAAAALAAPATAHAAPGAAGIGDPLFPKLGNGGYDALHYDVALRYPTTAPHQRIGGTVTMRARATQALSRFDLDYSGRRVLGVSVDGRAARFRRSGGELVITPRRAVANGRTFRARVAFVSGTHNSRASDDGLTTGWFTTADGSVMAGQPNDTHTIFPVNDHPADKATYAFRIDVPAGITAVANGLRTGRRTAGGRTVWRYAMHQPMASELVQVVAGLLKLTDQGRPHGVRIRSVADITVARRVESALRRTPAHVAWMVARVGPYPFPEYGVLAADARFGYALETQTLSLFPADLLDPSQSPPAVYEPIMVHELAHQWFGDSVAPERWSDVWLNEGHATWYEHEYGRQFYGQSAVAYYKDAYRRGNQLRARYGPVAQPKGNRFTSLFSDNVYSGGGLVLYALEQTVGDPTFRRIERTWAQGERGKSVGTEDFIAVAGRVAGQDLGPFLRAWVYGTTLPPMPGHPDWTAAPVRATAAALQPALARTPLPLARH